MLIDEDAGEESEEECEEEESEDKDDEDEEDEDDAIPVSDLEMEVEAPEHGLGFHEYWGEHEARAGTECQHEIYGVFEFVKPVLNGKKILGNFKVPPPATQGDAGLNGNPNLRAFQTAPGGSSSVTRP